MIGETLVSDNIDIIALWIKNRRKRKFAIYLIFSLLCAVHMLFILRFRVGAWSIVESIIQTALVVLWSTIAMWNAYGYATFKNWSVRGAYKCRVIAKSRTKVEARTKLRIDTGYYLYVEIDGKPIRSICEPEMYWVARKNDEVLSINIGDGNLYSMYIN